MPRFRSPKVLRRNQLTAVRRPHSELLQGMYSGIKLCKTLPITTLLQPLPDHFVGNLGSHGHYRIKRSAITHCRWFTVEYTGSIVRSDYGDWHVQIVSAADIPYKEDFPSDAITIANDSCSDRLFTRRLVRNQHSTGQKSMSTGMTCIAMKYILNITSIPLILNQQNRYYIQQLFVLAKRSKFY